jgi:hypothetical protein
MKWLKAACRYQLRAERTIPVAEAPLQRGEPTWFEPTGPLP